MCVFYVWGSSVRFKTQDSSDFVSKLFFTFKKKIQTCRKFWFCALSKLEKILRICSLSLLLSRLRRMWSQQTRDIDPMLDQYWSTGYDAGPTSVQHWVDVSCLLDWHCHPDTIFEIWAMTVCHWARYISVTEAPYSTESSEWVEEIVCLWDLIISRTCGTGLRCYRFNHSTPAPWYKVIRSSYLIPHFRLNQ